ncbi:methyltransferase domain-containing protein [Aquabacterium sp. A7-Y]|uniref:class I SAM-dependent methyltransferase n=1 Tax=Aquabacterium sp. A7-Y TaxID=1349605 RepID=UPI00223C8C48|nr:methyltransferase domain-containing protein [Aquabacterium sp. A7-Y]MCW7536287.1 methyltransferase domain-containing protein [Aquabacterium sp. A7-Y]
MIEERLSFSDSGSTYQALNFSEHFNRYAVAAEACKGKKVLDIACGEGYGSKLLSQWGASTVTGVDVSVEAIAAANKYFSGENVRYLRTDGTDLLSILGQERFDVIVSLETIEHVPDAKMFLETLRALLAPGGTLIVSCPNDHAHEWIDNPFHLVKYTLADFQALAEGVLGKADEWILGTPAIGHCHLPLHPSPVVADSPRDIMKGRVDHVRTWVLPAQENTAATPASCAYYVGRWGPAPLTLSLSYAPQSFRGAIELWELYQAATKTIAHLRDENRRIRSASLESIVVKQSPASLSEGKWAKRRRKWIRSLRKRLGLSITGY